LQGVLPSSLVAEGAVSSETTGSAAAPNGGTERPGFREKLNRWLTTTETEFSFVKGLTFLGAVGTLVGTLIAAFFQSASAYQEKIATQAKEDLAAATTTFTETSNALSSAITLQADLFHNFKDAKGGSDQSALPNKTASEMFKTYESANALLRQKINVFARRAEIYLDWPSNPNHDPENGSGLGRDPISTSALGAYDFDCDDDMPKFEKGDPPLQKKKGRDVLDVHWFSAKHHVLTIGYCFYTTHVGYMPIILQWSSHSPVDQNDIAEFFKEKGDEKHKYTQADVLQARLDSEVIRLNAFMTLAMNEIDRIRARYRPSAFHCYLPGVSWAARKCDPI
jgi:hypothetical protein